MKSREFYLSQVSTFSQLQYEKKVLRAKIRRKERDFEFNVEQLKDSYRGYNLVKRVLSGVITVIPTAISAGSYFSRLFSRRQKG